MLTLVAFFTMPILYTLPQILMTSELACMMPSNGGSVLWVNRAHGPYIGERTHGLS
jgi:amino acid transporter